MHTQTQNKGFRIIEERVRLGIPYDDPKTFFLYPSYGPNTFAHVGEAITKEGLARPTMADTVDLVHAAFNADDKYSQEIQRIMKDRWFWGFTGNLYIPQEGVYIQDNPRISNGLPFMEQSDLVQKLEAHDPRVRFVPFGFPIREMSALELARNPYIQGLVGEEGAEKLAEIADKHKYKPYLYSFASIDQPLTRVSALGSDGLVGRRLNVVGDDHGDDRNGYVFGVLDKTGEASRAEK